jgi:NAD(P)-dependent dehydrogenase (short-subunit alcohol dehydrogenase family)
MSKTSKVWLVTGSSRGLGRAIVEAALVAGHRVVATARKPEQLQEFAKRYGNHIRVVGLDVTDSEAAIGAVRTTVEAFGRLDMLVNNAGYGDIASLHNLRATNLSPVSCRKMCCFSIRRGSALRPARTFPRGGRGRRATSSGWA